MSTSQTKAARRVQAQRTAQRRHWTVGLIVTVVVVLAAIAAVVAPGGEDGDERVATAPVEVAGTPLLSLEEGVDPSVGTPAPELRGQDFEGRPVAITPGGRPMAVLFVAHWCPACQDEVRQVQAWVDAGDLPDGVDLLTVSTGVDRSRANYPPATWLEREGWTAPVLVDDQDSSAAVAYGLPAYPYFVFLDREGIVAARRAGVLSVEQLSDIVDQLARR